MARKFLAGFSSRLRLLALVLVVPFVLGACTGGALAPGLVASMDSPGATLNRSEALNLINQFRSSRGVAPLRADTGLDARAQALADQYAANGSRPAKPQNGIVHMALSAGYSNFAETFSGWRGRPEEASAIANATASTAGIAVAYAPNSTYGVHWVLLLGAPGVPLTPVPANR